METQPPPLKRRSLLPNFRPISIVAKRLNMHQDATWCGGRPQPRGLVLDEDRARLLNFRPMFIIVIVISLEHCTFVIGFFNFKFKF